jgi:membrane associated rhomboid family serine protease
VFALPLYDDNPTQRAAIVTWMVVGLCIAIFLWQQSLPARLGHAAALSFGMVPAVIFGTAHLPRELAVVPPWASLFTSMFLHGGWLHIAGNMLFLWIFGDNVEDAMGSLKFVVFYLTCGVVAALTQALAAPNSVVPMVGASGAIAGVLGAYLLLHPWANVRVLVVILIFIRLIDVPALIVLGLWFLGQVISAETTPASVGGVAFWAHIGGFLCGLLLLPIFKRRGVSLFGARRTRAFAVSGARVVRRGRIPTVIPHAPRDPWRGRRNPWH